MLLGTAAKYLDKILTYNIVSYMKVYRLQTRDNKGPYNAVGGFTTFPGLDIHAYPNYRAKDRNKYMPCATFRFTSQYIFGFAGLEQMRNWFSKRQLKAFDKHGYVLAIYTVKKKQALKDSAQVAFIPKRNPKFHPLSSVWEA